jgi:hypothetical protein
MSFYVTHTHTHTSRQKQSTPFSSFSIQPVWSQSCCIMAGSSSVCDGPDPILAAPSDPRKQQTNSAVRLCPIFHRLGHPLRLLLEPRGVLTCLCLLAPAPRLRRPDRASDPWPRISLPPAARRATQPLAHPLCVSAAFQALEMAVAAAPVEQRALADIFKELHISIRSLCPARDPAEKHRVITFPLPFRRMERARVRLHCVLLGSHRRHRGGPDQAVSCHGEAVLERDICLCHQGGV